jgi:hypothetical protein
MKIFVSGSLTVIGVIYRIEREVVTIAAVIHGKRLLDIE